ncbi:MAG: Unknown protein [uncultured Sulfurovum sp.]|uniref:Uncharacterized protein n=1 Tax=uncultured Sulfurovum sp. TaxID=269237 RepID=A0A6S6U749_9BACT|nr:MAG: Unknown protein [uncultured Sulfurovum sp.]
MFSSFLNGTHVHADEEQHFDDCQICTILTAFNDSPPINDLIDLKCELCGYLIETALPLNSIEITSLKGFFAHAPPCLSYLKNKIKTKKKLINILQKG